MTFREECALSICSASRAEPLVVDHFSGTFDFGDLQYFFFLLFGMKSLGRMDGDSSITVSEHYRRRIGGLRKARFTPTGSARIVSDWLAHFHCDAQ